MPFEKVQWLRRIMLDWDRWSSYQDSRGHDWFPKWLETRIFPADMIWKTFIPTLIAAIALCVTVMRWSRLRKLRSEIHGPAWLLACTLLAAAFWFSSAPDPRYASQIFVLMMVAALLLALASLSPAPSSSLRKCLPILSRNFLFAFGPFFLGSHEAQRYTGRTLAGAWILPPPSGLFYPTPQSQYTIVSTPSGLQIYVPVPPPGKTFEDRIWDGPLPNAPMSEIDPVEVHIPSLRLRMPNDLQSGFTRER